MSAQLINFAEGYFYNDVERDFIDIVIEPDMPKSMFVSSCQVMMGRDFQGVINKSFSKIVKIKVNGGMKRKAESGWYPSNNVPLGYMIGRSEKIKSSKRTAIVVPSNNPAAVKQVQREFELRANGVSYDEIVREITSEGYCYKCHASAVEKRIKNPFYGGNFMWQGTMYEGKHELIVDRATYRRATSIDKQRGGKPVLAYPLAGGFMKCAEPSCGCFITYELKKKKSRTTGLITEYPYFRCSNGKGVHDKKTYVKEAGRSG